jgi:hypothetical protein
MGGFSDADEEFNNKYGVNDTKSMAREDYEFIHMTRPQ